MSVVAVPSISPIPVWLPRRQIVIASTQMCEVIQMVHRVAASEVSAVLLQGETGTGKEVIASLLHESSSRSAYRFVAVNCAAIPADLLESELFGHERGAFTDARYRREGLLEEADGGTLFLDEISQMPLRLQAKLLRVLEGQSFRRVGGTVEILPNVRFVAATNEELPTAVRQGTFRMDLFYRLNVFPIYIPPLRDRVDDILPLAAHFIETYNRKLGRKIAGVSPEAGRVLVRYPWPGNVRQLRNAIERAMILEESSYLRTISLPPEIRGYEGGPQPEKDPNPQENLHLKDNQRRLILEALRRHSGNLTRSAAALGISRRGLSYYIKKYGLLFDPTPEMGRPGFFGR